MSGLLRRIRRPGGAEEPRTEPIALPGPAHSAPQPSNGEIAPEGGSRLPAGVAAEDLERRRATGRRGKLRRRARFLRRARELALRDLGGLVYEARRRGQDGGALVEAKAERLEAIDAELRELDAALGAPPGQTVLREPGVGGTCPRCGELHASDARFCAACGLDLGARKTPAAEATPAAGEEPAAGTMPAAGEEPAAGTMPAAEEERAAGTMPAAEDRPEAGEKPTTEAMPTAEDRPEAEEKPEAGAVPTAEATPAAGEKPTAEATPGDGNGRPAPAPAAAEPATPDRPA